MVSVYPEQLSVLHLDVSEVRSFGAQHTLQGKGRAQGQQDPQPAPAPLRNVLWILLRTHLGPFNAFIMYLNENSQAEGGQEVKAGTSMGWHSTP